MTGKLSRRLAALGLSMGVLIVGCGASKSRTDERTPARGAADGSAGRGSVAGGSAARAGATAAGGSAASNGAVGGEGGTLGSGPAGGRSNDGGTASGRAGEGDSGGAVGGGGSGNQAGEAGAVAIGGATGENGGGRPGAGGTGTESCDPIPCPDLGTCTAALEGTTCVRTCTPRFTQYEAKTSADLGVLIVAKCNVFDASLLAGGSGIVSLTGMQMLHEVTGALIISQSSLKSLKGLEGLARVGDLFELDQNANLESIELPALEDAAGGIEFGFSDSVQSIDLPGMKIMSDRLLIDRNTALESIHLANLEQANELFVEENDTLTTLELPALTQVRLLDISLNPKFPQCEVDQLAARVGGCDVYPGFCTGNDPNATCQ